MIPPDLVLQNDIVRLQPMKQEDYSDFFRLAQDEGAWTYFTLNLADAQHLQLWMDAAFLEKHGGTRRPFTIVDLQTGQTAGSTSFGNIAYADSRLEIGWSWLGREFRSTGINRNAKFLLMQYAFEVLQMERVEFKTDMLNARARQGLRNIGAIEEGVLRSHMKMWNNRRRDSVYYSVLKNEWEKLKQTIFKDIADEMD